MNLVSIFSIFLLTDLSSILFRAPPNQSLAQIWSNLPKQAGQSLVFTGKLEAASFLPKKLDYYRFNGSLTTPPCTEGVRWIVLKDIQSASEAQFDVFNKLLSHPNNRPVQPVNARVVLE